MISKLDKNCGRLLLIEVKYYNYFMLTKYIYIYIYIYIYLVISARLNCNWHCIIYFSMFMLMFVQDIFINHDFRCKILRIMYKNYRAINLAMSTVCNCALMQHLITLVHIVIGITSSHIM